MRRWPVSPLSIALLAPLVLVSTASRLSASGDAPREKKKIVIESPEREVVVDGDRVWISDDAGEGAGWMDGQGEIVGPEVFADLPDFDEDDFPRVLRFHGHGGGGYLGVRSIEMTPELRQHFGAPKDAGVLIGTVEPDGPAAKAGMQVGDILTAVDGEQVESTRALSRSVRRHKNGDSVKIDLLRDRAKKTLSVTLKEVERRDREVRIGEFGHGVRGFRWRGWDHDGPVVAPVPPVPPVAPMPPDAPRWNGLKDRMDSLEQRLKDLESRVPPR